MCVILKFNLNSNSWQEFAKMNPVQMWQDFKYAVHKSYFHSTKKNLNITFKSLSRVDVPCHSYIFLYHSQGLSFHKILVNERKALKGLNYST